MTAAGELVLAVLSGLPLAAAPEHEHARPPAAAPSAPGYSQLGFATPAPGTYELPPLGTAADGRVLESSGRPTRLHEIYGDKVVVLSFIYTSCADVNGCPLASFVLSLVQRKAAADPQLRDSLRLVSLSFDAVQDSPERMTSYGQAFRREGFDWHFLTCASERDLAPILESYGQAAYPDRDEHGRLLGTASHLLRVYLIDRHKRIRNIYTPSFLHADLLLADIRTVLAEDQSRPEPDAPTGGPTG